MPSYTLKYKVEIYRIIIACFILQNESSDYANLEVLRVFLIYSFITEAVSEYLIRRRSRIASNVHNIKSNTHYTANAANLLMTFILMPLLIKLPDHSSPIVSIQNDNSNEWMLADNRLVSNSVKVATARLLWRAVPTNVTASDQPCPSNTNNEKRQLRRSIDK